MLYGAPLRVQARSPHGSPRQGFLSQRERLPLHPAAGAGYRTVTVPGVFSTPNLATLPAGFKPQPSPFGVTFSGPAFSEPKLIGYASALEQVTPHRAATSSVPKSRRSSRGAAPG